MKYRITGKIVFCIFLLTLLFCTGCSGTKEDEITWSRHAFLLEDDLVFIADVPDNWRYILEPVNDYGYYYDIMNDSLRGIRNVHFVGMGEWDGEENFWDIIVHQGKIGRDAPQYAENLPEYVQEPFAFRDGTQGIREYYIWEKHLLYSMQNKTEEAYREYIYDTEEKYVIKLFMLKKEYDANEAEINRFLESACFRTSDLGLSEETELYKRDLLTLHLWDEYVRMSLQVPEGSLIEKMYYTSEVDYAACAYTIYFDEGKSDYIVIYAESGAEFDSCGDTDFYLNVEDFEDTVYELKGFSEGYYFVNQQVRIRPVIDADDTELNEYVKKIVQSIKFE